MKVCKSGYSTDMHEAAEFPIIANVMDMFFFSFFDANRNIRKALQRISASVDSDILI